MSKLKKTILIIWAILSLPFIVYAAPIPFNSFQVGSSPTNGYILQTNGSNSTWVPNSATGGGNSKWATSTVNSNAISPNSATLVGIGTNNPTDVNANAKLTVAGISSQDIIASTTDNTTLSDAILQAYAPGSRIFMGAHGTNQVSTRYGLTLGGWGEITAMNSTSGTTNGLIVGTNTNTPFVLGTNNKEIIRITGGGFTGIGTSTPNRLITLSATGTQDQLLFEDASTTVPNTSYGSIGFSRGDMLFNTLTNALATTTRMIIKANGNVGIGTTSPLYPLQVFNANANTAASFCGQFQACINFSSASGGPSIQAFANLQNTVVSKLILQPSAGNVGIGTSTPNNILDIYSVGKPAIGFSGAGDSTYKWTMGMDVPNGGNFIIASSTILTTNPRFVIDGNGNTGIGTTTPFATFSVNPIAGGALNRFAVASSSASAFVIDNSGNVGIGKTQPTVALDVVGALNTTGTITAGGSTINGANGVIIGANRIQATTVDLTGNGTAAGPSYANIALSNSGMYWCTNSNVCFSQGGVNAGTIGANQRWGMGTTTPWGILSIASSTATGGSQNDPFFVVASTTGNANTIGFIVDKNLRVGLGTTTPYASLSVQATSTAGDAFVVATSSNAMVFGIDNDGHRFSSGPAGTIGACGTGTGTVVGDDGTGTITTATAATSCVYNFTKAVQQIPSCQVSDDSTVGFASVTSVSTTAVTFGISSALTGAKLYYSCGYHKPSPN